MLFVVHNVSSGRSVLKVGEKKLFCHWHVDGISAFFCICVENENELIKKRIIKFSLSLTW